METPLVSIYCPHCHRYTSLTPAKTPPITGNPIEVVYCRWVKGNSDVWWIGICNHCKNPVLVHNDGDVVYPSPLPSPSDENIPNDIRKDLDEAKMCFSVGAYRACAVIARRAIQSSCINKGCSSKKNLADQLQELLNNGIITKDLKEWADVVRWVGNDAAHPNNEEVSQEDADDILRLAEHFLHVMFVAPAIAKERKNKMKK